MTLYEKFAALTSEQQAKFAEINDETGLDAFLTEVGGELTPDEKIEALKRFKKESTLLQDEELENAAGGNCTAVIEEKQSYHLYEPNLKYTGRHCASYNGQHCKNLCTCRDKCCRDGYHVYLPCQSTRWCFPQ